MSDLDIFAWSLIRPFHYLQKIHGPLKANVNKARAEIDEILASKGAGNFDFYKLCWGMQRLNPSLGHAGLNEVTLASKAKNGFASFLLAQVKQKEINPNFQKPLKGQVEENLRDTRDYGYLHAAFELGVHELKSYHFKTAFKYFKSAAHAHSDCQKFSADPALTKLMAIRKNVDEEEALAQKEMAIIWSGNAHKVLGSSSRILPFLSPNEDKARDLFQKSVGHGDADAQFHFAEFLFQDPARSREDYNLADTLYEEAAHSGHILACERLATHAYTNFDFAKAIKIYKLFKQNKAKPVPNVPQFHSVLPGAGWAKRIATPDPAFSLFAHKEFIEEMDLYERTLENDAIALKNLGARLLNRPVPPIQLAESFLKRSFELGCKEALFFLAEILIRPGQNQNLAQIKEMYSSVADLVPRAHSRLGNIALHEGNFENAIRHYDLALQSNDPLAISMCNDPGFKLLEMYVGSQEPMKKYFLAKIISNEQNRKIVLNENGESQLIIFIHNNLEKAVSMLEKLLLELQPTDIENIIKVCMLLHDLYMIDSVPNNPHRAMELLLTLDDLGNGRVIEMFV